MIARQMHHFSIAKCLTALGLTGLFGLSVFAGDAVAQNRSDEEVFVDLGRWTIVQRPASRSCELRLAPEGYGSLVYSKAKGRPGALRLDRTNAAYTSGESVAWSFDGTQFSGQLVNGRTYVPSSDSSAIEQQFRQAKFLTLLDSGQTVARISLKTSSAGFRLLNQCAEQWRDGVVAMPPERPATIARRTAQTPAAQRRLPPIPRSQPASQPASQAQPPARPTFQPTGPFPPNRVAKPINPGNWVRSDDFRRLNQRQFGNGTLRFTLVVDKRGRADECIVNTSSGSRDFDSRACRTLQKRARFEPATDANGDAKSSTYSSSVRVAVE